MPAHRKSHTPWVSDSRKTTSPATFEGLRKCMAKDNEKKIAEVDYVKNGKTAKEIAAIYGLSENTVGKWVKEGGWKERRIAHETGSQKLIESYDELLEVLIQKRLLLEKDPPKKRHNESDEERLERLEYNQKEKVRITDEIAKINKAKESAEKEGKISLSVYLEVTSSVFQAMQKYDPNLYMQTLEFQRQHVTDKSNQDN